MIYLFIACSTSPFVEEKKALEHFVQAKKDYQEKRYALAADGFNKARHIDSTSTVLANWRP